MFPFCLLLSAFSENGVCLLISLQRKLFSFTCSSCGIQTSDDFENCKCRIVKIPLAERKRAKLVEFNYAFEATKNNNTT